MTDKQQKKGCCQRKYTNAGGGACGVLGGRAPPPRPRRSPREGSRGREGRGRRNGAQAQRLG